MIQLAPRKLCTGCFSCFDACHHNAIQVIKINEIPFPKIDSNICVKCHACENSCPILNPISRNNISEFKVFGGWAKDDTLRIPAASGGAFSALALTFLTKYSDKAYVVGAQLTKNNEVEHIIIDTPQDISLLRNSKYIQSNTIGIFRKVKEKLNNGAHVLFSGTPCIVAGLYGYLRNNYPKERLITIDLVCNSVASKEALKIALQLANADRIAFFRDKIGGQANGQTTTMIINGAPKRNNHNSDPFYKIFGSGLLARPSCSNCKYSRINRIADITLADFWGLNSLEQEYQKGISLIIANNEHGFQIIKSSEKNLNIFNSSISKALRSNPRLHSGYKFIQYHPIVLYGDFFKRILPNKIRISILENQMPWRLLWGILRYMTKLYEKYNYRHIVKKYKI